MHCLVQPRHVDRHADIALETEKGCASIGRCEQIHELAHWYAVIAVALSWAALVPDCQYSRGLLIVDGMDGFAAQNDSCGHFV